MNNDNKLDVANLLNNFSYCDSTGLLIRNSTRKNVGSLNTNGYLETIIKGIRYLVHRLVWLIATGSFPAQCIDHINGVRTDNRLCNLRATTIAENLLNKKRYSNNSTGFKGVYYSKSKGKYEAQVRFNNRKYSFGGFDTAEEASKMYELKSSELFKEFKRENE